MDLNSAQLKVMACSKLYIMWKAKEFNNITNSGLLALKHFCTSQYVINNVHKSEPFHQSSHGHLLFDPSKQEKEDKNLRKHK